MTPIFQKPGGAEPLISRRAPGSSLLYGVLPATLIGLAFWELDPDLDAGLDRLRFRTLVPCGPNRPSLLLPATSAIECKADIVKDRP
jgi:hypothetical protein